MGEERKRENVREKKEKKEEEEEKQRERFKGNVPKGLIEPSVPLIL